jgi:hypothetical protein
MAITPSQTESDTDGTVTLVRFDVGAKLHPTFDMSVLSQGLETMTVQSTVSGTTVVVCSANA